AGILSLALTQPLRDAHDPLAGAAANANQVTVAALCVLLMGLSPAMVPVVLYPVLKRHNEVLALGYLVFRGALETVIGLVAPIAWLLLVAIGRSYVPAGDAATAGLQASGALLLKAGGHSALAGIIFCLGALMFYALLYRSRLVPRWISVWGVAALVPYLAAEFLAVFALVDPMSSNAILLYMPLAGQEMVLAGWLIAKGFNSSAVAPEATKTATNELLSAA
ncbi:MAG: DUF4386 domain-containing protein, partial [Caldilineaceae bacterium]|nr:DUF4386 domain-containing protein [Caldilineaceae bacterium]